MTCGLLRIRRQRFKFAAKVDDGKPGTPASFIGRGDLSTTFLFKTREGARGVLQILQRNGHDSVKIRYKLAKPLAAAP